jgi:hypothetical protein
MATTIPTDKARQGRWGRHVLLILIIALLLTGVVWVAVEIYGESTDRDAPGNISVIVAPSDPSSGAGFAVA